MACKGTFAYKYMFLCLALFCRFEGVVFLDENDQKMILVKATNRVMKLAQCGISEKRRFAFYDQVCDVLNV
jgi:hypothetical protein